MNPTDEVDDLLAQAGAQWRADQPSPPEPDLDRILKGSRRPRRWIPVLAAASVAAIAAVMLTVLPDNGPKLTAPVSRTPNDDLLVHDGDKVQVSGQVFLAPGRKPLFCALLPTADPGFSVKSGEYGICDPQYAVTLKNFDPAKLGAAEPTKGVRTYVQLTGIWNARTLEVQDQAKLSGPPRISAGLSSPPDPVPCPAPEGGWSTEPLKVDKIAVSKFLDARRDQVTDPLVLSPNGRVSGSPEVYTIGVAHGDLDAFRRAFEEVYDGNLCVHRVKYSEAELDRMATYVGKLIPKGLGVWSVSKPDVDEIGVSALVYDEALKTALGPIGLENVQLYTMVKPVR